MAFNAAANGSSTALTGTLTSSALTSAANQNAYILFSYFNNVGRVISSIGDSKGNAFSQLTGSPFTFGANQTAMGIYYCENMPGFGAGHTFNGVTSVSGAPASIIAAVMSGRAYSGSIRAIGSSVDPTNTPTHPGATVTAVSTDDVIALTAEGDNPNGTEVFTAGSGFTIPANGTNTIQEAPSFVQYQLNVSAGNYTGAYTAANYNHAMQVILALAAQPAAPASQAGLLLTLLGVG